MDTLAIRTTRKLVRPGGVGFPAFQAAALEFADRHGDEALRKCAELYVERGLKNTTFPPIADRMGVISTLGWALQRPDHTPERRLAAGAVAMAAIPVEEYGEMTPEEQYVLTHAAIEKAVQAKSEYDADLAWLIAQSEAREKRRKAKPALVLGMFVLSALIILSVIV